MLPGRRGRIAGLAILLLAGSGLCYPDPVIPQHLQGKAVPGEVLVSFTTPVTLDGLRETVARARRAPVAIEARPLFAHARSRRSGAPGGSATWRVRFADGGKPEALAAEARTWDGVRYAEPNWIGSLASDPLLPQVQAEYDRIGVPGAWIAQAGAAPSVRVAVIDSGIQATHEDLLGTVDLANSYDFQGGTATVSDDIGHGTRIAGLIAAVRDNGMGAAGVGYGCTLWSLDVADPLGAITVADVAEAVDWATVRGADVANMSLRFSGYSQTLEDACDAAAAAGVLLVAAAGNENQGDLAAYPAAFDSVMGVGALADDGVSRAPFSNFNGVQRGLVDLVAPGETLLTTVPPGLYSASGSSGTSFAAPLVAGTAALLKSKYPAQSGAALRAHLLATAEPLTSAFVPATGGGSGVLDAEAALTTAMTPLARIAQVRVEDSPSLSAVNDGDGALDDGETARIVVTLEVEGADVAAVVGVLSTGDPDIGALAEDSAAFGAVRIGSPASNQTEPFGSFLVSPTATEGTATFSLALSGAGGFTATLPFDLPIEDEITVSGVVVGDPDPFVFEGNKTYRIAGPGDLFLEGVVTVEPGCTIKVDPGVDIQVGAGCTFTAEGTEALPIVFARAKGPVVTAGRWADLGPQNEPVALGAYAHVRYVSASTGSDTTGDGSAGNPYASIQFAINSIGDASPTNRYAVLVAGGTYTATHDPVVTMSDYVDLYGGFSPGTWQRDVHGAAARISGESVRACVVGATARLDGFDVVEGQTGGSGGGLTSGDPMTVANCRFMRNNQTSEGAVVIDSSTESLIRNSVFAFNTATEASAAVLSKTRLEKCVFVQNGSSSSSCATLRGGARVANCAFLFERHNSAPSWTGSALTVQSLGTGDFGELKLTGNAFVRCQAGSSGPGSGGVLVDESDYPAVMDDNLFFQSSGRDFYVWDDGSQTPTSALFRNSIHVRSSFNTTAPVLEAPFGGIDIRNSTMARIAPTDQGITTLCTAQSGSIQNSIVRAAAIQTLNIGGAITHSNVQGGAGGVGNYDEPGWAVKVQLRVPVAAMYFDPDRGQTRLVPLGTMPDRDVLVGQLLLLQGPTGSIVAEADATGLWLWGDVFAFSGTAWVGQEGKVFADAYVPDFGLDPTSPDVGMGIGPALDPAVPAFDVDGDPRTGSICDVGADEYNEASDATAAFWGELQLLDGAGAARLRHARFADGSGVRIETADTLLEDLRFEGNDPRGVVATAPLLYPATRLVAERNYGAGVDLPGTDLIECSATSNSGVGLTGAVVSSSGAFGNFGTGISAEQAVDCIAEGNAQTGISIAGSAISEDLLARGNGGTGLSVSGGTVRNARAEGNGTGVVASNGATLESVVATLNASHGIQADGSAVSGSTSSYNGGVGVSAGGGTVLSSGTIVGNAGAATAGVSEVRDSVLVSNGGGAAGATLVLGSVIAENPGAAVSGGTCTSSVLLANAGPGFSGSGSVVNSWIVRNAGAGVLGNAATPPTVANSTVRDNTGEGIVNALSVGLCNIFGNHASASPALQVRVQLSGSGAVNYENCWWGGANAALLAAAAANANMPFVRDALDGSGSRRADLWPYRATAVADAPTSAAPAFLLSVVPNPLEAVGVGLTTFTLEFSEAMDPAIEPAVTFGLESPYTEKVVPADPGWIDERTWRGTFWIESDTGDGVNRVRVSGARAADGFALHDDTSNSFVIDTSGEGSANSGGAIGTGRKSLRIEWTANGAASLDPAARTIPIQGYYVMRSTVNEGGSFERANQILVPAGQTYYEDEAVEYGVTYFYRVYVLTDGFEGLQWTPTFSGKDEPVGPTPTPTPTPSPTPTPTATPTPTPTPSPTPAALTATIVSEPPPANSRHRRWRIEFNQPVPGAFGSPNLQPTGTLAETSLLASVTSDTLAHIVAVPLDDTSEGTIGFDLVGPLAGAYGVPFAGPLSAQLQQVDYFPPGDVNRDGSFDIADVILLANANVGLAVLP